MTWRSYDEMFVAKRATQCAAAALVIVAGHAWAESVENPYAKYTDEELTELASDWQSLSTEDRRDFFTEMRRRMATNGQKQSIPVRAERRFGRIVRKPDGSVVRIETVVQYHAQGETNEVEGGADTASQPEGPESDTQGQPSYGTGFEQRVADQKPDTEQSSASPAVITVKKPNSG